MLSNFYPSCTALRNTTSTVDEIEHENIGTYEEVSIVSLESFQQAKLNMFTIVITIMFYK